MIANFLHTKFTFVYIYIIFMLHFVKNEDEVKMTIASEFLNIKLEASLDTTTEGGKNFYELLKEKKTMKLTFNISPLGILYASADNNEDFKLIAENTILSSLEGQETYSIFADNNGLGILLGDYSSDGMVIGKVISTEESINNFMSSIVLKVLNEGSSSFELEFALEENQKESNPKYYIDLLFLTSSIIIIILLFVCLLSFLTK